MKRHDSYTLKRCKTVRKENRSWKQELKSLLRNPGRGNIYVHQSYATVSSAVCVRLYFLQIGSSIIILYIFSGSSADSYSRNLLHANYPACFDVNRYKIEIKNHTQYLQFLYIGKSVYIVKLG